MVHPTDMTNPVGVAATEFTAGGRHFPTPHPPRKRQGGGMLTAGPPAMHGASGVLITPAGGWSQGGAGSRDG